ncbi:MAG: hypothetical protein ABI467_15595 [Kofleriaceae bacterium]
MFVQKSWLLFALAPACVGAMSTGIVVPVGRSALPSQQPAGTAAAVVDQASTPTGVELHVFGATKLESAMPNAWGYSIRQIGDEHVEQEYQVGWAGGMPTPAGMVFGRLMFDLISWQMRADGDRQLSAFSPTLEVGIAPGSVHGGWCISGEVTRDIHLNDPDRTLVGLFVGLCGSGNSP